MKSISIILLAILLSVTSVCADITVTLTLVQQVTITLNPNGPLDAAPTWTATGSAGALLVQGGGSSAIFVPGEAGTNLVKIVATSQGNPLTETVKVVVLAPVPPATSLGVTTSVSAKP